MTQPKAFVRIERLTDHRNTTEFFTGYAWDTDTLTLRAYNEAKQKCAVLVDRADYLVDFYRDTDSPTLC